TDTRRGTETGGGVCVGKPVAGMEVAVIAIDDDAIGKWSDAVTLPTGEIGEIVVKGPVVTPSYFNRDASTRLAKIADDDGTVRHRMGDVGYLDEQGRLWMCGRKAHRVQSKAGPMFTVNCEAVFNRHAAVRRTALVGVKSDTGVRPVLCVELEAGREGEWETVRRDLAGLATEHDHTARIEEFVRHPGSFPVDVRHNSKIFREKLAVWAQERVS
ncbi:MAG: peptide synthase, partial [Myxococcota bacterium]